MNINQLIYKEAGGWESVFKKGTQQNAQLVMAFGQRGFLAKRRIYEELKAKFPSADIVICSTAGEIANASVYEETVVVTAIEFEHSNFKAIRINIEDCADSFEAGRKIVDQLCRNDLNHVFVLSDGHLINGSHLVSGLNNFRCKKIGITGGLAGDGIDFNHTLVGLNGPPSKGEIVAIGFYGDRLKIGMGCKGGWDPFGPERKVTRSVNNVLYELDGQSALSLYKQYLGDAAKELPSSALYFPLSIKTGSDKDLLVRTILSINEEDQSMTFAGNIPMGSTVRLMKHNGDKLIEGAELAAQLCMESLENTAKPELAILVSCVGRKIVLGQNIEEEVEVVRDSVGQETAITGFYSYGEIAPQQYFSNCELHNQTMTITTFSEV